MKIIVENSTWNNIGDGFYQSALYSLLKKTYPEHNILMGEGPIKRAFRPRTAAQEKNAFSLMQYQSADIHVFSGPILRTFLNVYAEKIKSIKDRGENYVFISVSSAGISDSVLVETGEFLKKYPPLFASTRDPETFHKFKSYIKNCYNGICTAFLVNRTLPVDEIQPPFPFFVSSFYRELEPVYSTVGPVSIENVSLERKETFFNIKNQFSRHFNFLRPQQENLNDHKIIRVHQDVSTHFHHIKFSHPNSFMSFNLLSYLSLYKSADFTISDRVHSCAASLAFGKPARLFTKSLRAGIFERLNFDYKSNEGIMYPNLDIIDTEMDKMVLEIKRYI